MSSSIRLLEIITNLENIENLTYTTVVPEGCEIYLNFIDTVTDVLWVSLN